MNMASSLTSPSIQELEIVLSKEEMDLISNVMSDCTTMTQHCSTYIQQSLSIMELIIENITELQTPQK